LRHKDKLNRNYFRNKQKAEEAHSNVQESSDFSEGLHQVQKVVNIIIIVLERKIVVGDLGHNR
jgi:hypothetical protein